MQVHQVPADHGPDGPPHHHAPCDGPTPGCTARRSLFELQDVDLAFEWGTVMGLSDPFGAEEVLLGDFLPLAAWLDRYAAVGGVTQWLPPVSHA